MEEKMFRAYLIIPILHLCFIFQGCVALEYLDGSSKEEIKEFKMTKEEMRDEMERLKIENAKLQEQMNTSREENERIKDENEKKMAKMRDQTELLKEQRDKLKKDSQRISEESQVLTKKLNKPEVKHETASSKSYELEKDIRKSKIKVLSGDGNLNSAKEMAKKLRNMGYEIKLIHYAPRSNFLRNTVYFAPKFQNEAKRLVLSLGDNAISKPLTWTSVFDVIVVTGKISPKIDTGKK